LQQKFTENARSGCRLSFANSFGDSVTDYLPSAENGGKYGAVCPMGRRRCARSAGHLIGWVPVCLAVGIGAYFHAARGTFGVGFAVGAGGAALLVALAVWAGEVAGPVILGAAAGFESGFDLAAWRAHAVGGPVVGVALLRAYRWAGGGPRPEPV